MARRDQVQGTVMADGEDSPAAIRVVKMQAMDPCEVNQRMWDTIQDDFRWRDRQQHGRLGYEVMLRHAAVRAPYQSVMAILESARVGYKSPVNDPSDIQKQMVEFLNDQLREHWDTILGGLIEPGFEFGFTVGEWQLALKEWRDRPMWQVNRIYPLPQSSLDGGDMPREEYGEVSGMRPRYDCFDVDQHGNVIRVWQYRYGQSILAKHHIKGPITWEGEDLKNILHFKVGGRDGNPYGESILFSAFYAWQDLFDVELRERLFIQNSSVPYLTATHEGPPSPGQTDELVTLIEQQDFYRLLTAGMGTKFGKVTASDPDFTQHVDLYKKQKRADIAMSILVPEGAFTTTDTNEQNLRDSVMLFVKFRIGQLFRQIEHFMYDFGRRLLDENYSFVKPHEYPVFEMQANLESDLKTATALLQQVIPYIDESRLGEAVESFTSLFRKEWIPSKHENSVEVKRPRRDSNDEPNSITGDSKTAPPDRSGERGDGQSKGNAV